MVGTPYNMTVQPDADGVPVLSGLNRAREVIALKESGGDYSRVGPLDRRGDRPYGRYQVMGRNVGPWTKEILGVEMTPEQFRADEKAQDAVFNTKFGQYAKKYGNFSDAASLWHSGKPLAKAAGRKDVLGTNTIDYVKDFDRLYGTQGPINVRSFAGGGAPIDYNNNALNIDQTTVTDNRNGLTDLGDTLKSTFASGGSSRPITKPNTPLWGGDMLGGALSRVQKL